MISRRVALVLLALVCAQPALATKKALFDNYHAETAGNADWEIDTHQPIPSPDQSGITQSTGGTYWTGAISSWGVDLVKRGYSVATNTTALTYGNGSNTYDLSNYDVLIVDEPNTVFTSAEATAILSFIQNGGGLVAVSDHSGSDRNNDGYDSPMIWNAMDPTHLLGVHFGVSGDSNNDISQTSNNINAAASDSVTHGTTGTVTGLAFHNGTTMTMYPAVNSTVRGEVWMTGVAQTSTASVMAASSTYGTGRAVFVCDSSPADDGTAAPGNSSIYDGWGEAGATDSTLFLNATLWVTRHTGSADTTPPTAAVTSPNGGESWGAGVAHNITWTASDNVGVTAIDLAYSTNAGTNWISLASSLANTGTYAWTVPATPSTQSLVRVTAHDAAGNTGTDQSNAVFSITDINAPTVAVTSPNGGENWAGGSTQNLTWTASDNVGVTTVDLAYSTNNGAAWSNIATGLANSGSYAWTLPATATTQALARVKAHDAAGNIGTDQSNAVFTIRMCTLTASAGTGGSITPAGAVSVTPGSSQAFAIAPDACTQIASVLVDGVSVGAVSGYTFTNVQTDHTIAASFSLRTYTVAASAGSGGGISPSGNVTVNCGAGQSFSITPDGCHIVADVLVDGVSVGAVSSYSFSGVTANHTIAASFAEKSLTIAAQAGGGGAINPSGNVAVNCGAGQFFSVAPDSCHTVADVLVDGASVGAVTFYSFAGVTVNHSIAASFALRSLLIDASAGDGGTIDPAGNVPVNCGADQAFSIAPDACSEIQDVLVDGVSVGAVSSYTFSGVRAGHTISAVFALRSFTITAGAGAHGSISPAGQVPVSCGSSQSFSIVPDPGYDILDVSVDGLSQGPVPSYTFSQVAAAHTIEASFDTGIFAIQSSAGAGGSISPSGVIPVHLGSDQAFAIAPATGYHILDVLVDGVSQGPVPGYTFTGVSAAHSIAASFAIDSFTLAASVSGQGSVQVSPLQSRYDYGTQVQLTASGTNGWGLDHWSGDASGSANPLTVVMTADRSITAVFADVTPPSVTVLGPNGGEVWAPGVTEPVTWTAADNVGVISIDLAYSTDGGASYPNVIATGLANTGSYSWVVPADGSAAVRVRVTARDAAGNALSDGSDADFEIRDPASSVAGALPGSGMAVAAVPNPAAGGEIRVFYRIEGAAPLEIGIYDVRGHLVRRLARGTAAGRSGETSWDGRDETGNPAAAGIYLLRLDAGPGRRALGRLILLR